MGTDRESKILKAIGEELWRQNELSRGFVYQRAGHVFTLDGDFDVADIAAAVFNALKEERFVKPVIGDGVDSSQ